MRNMIEAIHAGEMATKIMESISSANPESVKYTPDALMRVYVYLAKSNGWALEKIEEEANIAIKYYFEKEKDFEK